MRWISLPRVRLFFQAAFLCLSLSVFLGLVRARGIVLFYDSMHVFPALSAAIWNVCPPGVYLDFHFKKQMLPYLPGMALFMLGSGLAVTLFILLLPLAVGRVYCSYLCPAGFLQDAVRFSAARVGITGRPAGRSWGLRYFILGLTLAFVALRSSSYHYFDHFSNLGRLYGFGWSAFDAGSVPALAFLGALSAAAFRPRWFCSVVCPSGTLFMLLQRFSILRLRVSGRGAAACPVLCIGRDGIDEDLCIRCFECVARGPSGGARLSWRLPFRRSGAAEKSAPDGLGRRRFLAGAAAALGVLTAAVIRRRFPSRDPAILVPPGGVSARQFLDRCTACQACVSVCPTRVLVPSGPAKVRMDYDRSCCAYDCNACTAVCPSGALTYFPLEFKQGIKIGSARLDKTLCIPYAQGGDCRACREACPTGAIRMERRGAIHVPVLEDARCIGCGACQHACPVDPRKAITVEPLAVHSVASGGGVEGGAFPF